MKIQFYLVSLILLVSSGCAHHHENHQGHHEEAEQRLRLNNGKRWVPDGVLREAMDSMHDGLVTLIRKRKTGKIQQEDYLKYHRFINMKTETLIANCKMTPEMDEVYHVILERILDANENIKSQGSRDKSIKDFIQSFMDYQKFFDHKLRH